MMKKLFYFCFTALTMLCAMTGLSRAQFVLTFTDLYSGDKYGKYVPFHAKLTSNGVEQQNFEVYYTIGGATPSKEEYVAGEEANTGFYRAIATDGRAEILFSYDEVPYFQAVAYISGGFTPSNTVSKALTALNVAEPSFNPPAPRFGKTPVAPNTVVKIIDGAGGCDIYYSIDGETTPLRSQFGKNSNIYRYDDEAGVLVTEDVVICAIAYKSIDGDWGGSDMVRGGFEMDNKPQVQLQLNNITDGAWTIGQDAPTLTVTALNGATLGTGANDVAVKLKYTITGATWEQIITESGTSLDMSKATAAHQEDYCDIACGLVKGNATSVKVSNIQLTPEVLGFQIEVPGEAPARPVFTPPGRSADGKSGDTVLKGSQVTIECATEGADIYYVMNKDDAAPTVKYTKPITINSNSVIHAVSRKNGKSSDLVSGVYVITNDPDEVTHRPETVAAPKISVPSGEVATGTTVYLQCETPGAEIRYTVDGSTPTASSTPYTTPITVNEAMTIKAIAIKGDLLSEMAEAVYTIKSANPVDPVDPDNPDNPDNPTPETIATPEISYESGELNAGTIVYIHCETPGVEIRYTVDGSTPTTSSTLYTSAGITVNGPLTLKAIAFKGDLASEVAEATYTIKADDPGGEKIELYFSPVSGSEVYEGQEVNIIASKPYITEIFYMMFSSEEEARATEWNQGAAQPFNTEMKPVLSLEENTIKAAFVRPGNTAVDREFFYATYTVKEMPDITLTFDPASGSNVKAGTAVTVTANREADIFYNLYADKAAADADGSFVYDSKTVEENGMPVITKDKPYLRCGVYQNGMVYFDASYSVTEIELTFDPASGNEVEDGATVTVTANREIDIYYNLYADKAAADADGAFINTANLVADGMPVITGANPYLRCGVFDGKMVYFDACYTIKETVAKPTFSVKAGRVEKGTKVEIACETEGAVIYFTVDGTNPTAKSVPYKEAVEIDEAMTIKAIAVKGDIASEVAEASYTVKVANESEELAGVRVYPNPGDGLFHIELPEAATVDVFACNGALFRRLNLSAGVSTFNIERSGIYFLRIAGDGGRVAIKRIIVR